MARTLKAFGVAPDEPLFVQLVADGPSYKVRKPTAGEYYEYMHLHDLETNEDSERAFELLGKWLPDVPGDVLRDLPWEQFVAVLAFCVFGEAPSAEKEGGSGEAGAGENSQGNSPAQ